MEEKYCNEYYSKREKCCLDSVLSVIIFFNAYFANVNYSLIQPHYTTKSEKSTIKEAD